jgi:mannosylglycerate hydrolase
VGRKLVTVVSHTHWDRAWYCTFQEFRVRLVRLVDRLIDLIEGDPSYGVFMLDGQMAVLEDYLEVRPEQGERLRALTRAGRISVGPWYVLADEFLVSPEALIRNLSLGLRMAEEYGGALRAGYVPDGFGHIAQLPQILRGFAIDSAFFWRGMGAEGDELGTEFAWRAPDGSEVTAIFMPWGYHNLSNVGFVIRWGDTSQMELDNPLALRQIAKALSDLAPMARTPAFLLMNGIDHAEAEPRIPELLVRARTEFPDADFRQGTVLDHLSAVRAAGVALPSFRGEFRWGRYSEVLQGVYSTRMPLKQRNHRVETLLERSTEPLAALAWLAGASPQDGTEALISTAWKWLLRNHPHDDIYGSGIDQVHHEMDFRFDQAEQIGEVVVRDSLRALARRIDFSGQQGMPILVYNPLNWPRDEVVIAEVDFDFDDPIAAGFELVDHTGARVDAQVLGSREVTWLEPLKPNRKRRVAVAFTASVPACGYTTVYARPRSGRGSAGTRPGSGPLAFSERGAENGLVRFRIESDGRIELHDKRTGATYPHLLSFEDVEDAGDEYSSSPAASGGRFSSAGAPAAVERIAEGPALVRFRIRSELRVPASLLADRSGRSPELVGLPIESVITLAADSPVLAIETTVGNAARDHKLSVRFPTPFAPRTVQVDQAFAVVDRAVDLPPAAGWVEDPTPLMHQRAFVDLSDGARGLAVANRGLPSVEVAREPEGTSIAVTLLRCVGWLSRDDLRTRRVAAGPLLETPGAQCQGKHVFSFAVIPHAGDWREVFQACHAFVTPVLCARADTHEGMVLREMPFIGVDVAYADRTVRPIPWPRGGDLPSHRSVLETEPAGLLLSSLRRGGNGEGIVARLYNPDCSRGGRFRVRCTFPLREAHLVSLEERRVTPLEVGSRGEIEIDVPAGRIVTLELVV